MYDGWTPSERHEHFDADGNLAGWTVVTRESEWDDQSRDEAEALYLMPGRDHEKLCRCGCGYPAELTQDTSKSWEIVPEHCEYSRQMAIAQRMWDKQHENAQPDRDGAYPTDGVTLSLRPPESKE